jgi:Flp pilus assembly protein TadD
MNRQQRYCRYVAAVIVAGALAAFVSRATLGATGEPADEQAYVVYQPKLAVPDFMAPFLKHLGAADDAFTTERDATEIAARLRELGTALQGGASREARSIDWLLAPGFRGSPLTAGEQLVGEVAGPLEVRRAKETAHDLTLDARSFSAEIHRLVEDLREVSVTEFLITAIEPTQPTESVQTDVRYDIVGAGATALRVERVGTWRLLWRKGPSGWQVVEWTPSAHTTSRARTPIFTEVTEAVLGRNDSFTRQLSTGLDAWMATFDSVLTRDSNGHQGVSVGDADGDGLDDLYIAQPSGLPNRLFRARGDSTFEDVTERSGLGVLDDTAQSLFVDVDNDGDEDLVLATGTRPLLFLNDGTGRFSEVPDAFRFQQPLQGVLTSISMADYDRDGFVDLYLCVYSYFFGAGEDKAGTPVPYYDARNGPPGVLFHNDGKGHFVDVTAEAGLAEGNDRYHFAAAWADYDNDGWPDLLVANDFGAKNLYRNRGRVGGKVTFEDVAAKAGVLDYGAGMSATFFDYDNDGLLDIYTGNMWSANGLRVTSSPAFMPEAPPDVRALYHRHARGNSLFRNRGDGGFEDKTIDARAAMGRWAWSSDALDFDSDGWDDLYVVNGMLTRESAQDDLDSFFWRQVVARSPLAPAKGTPYDDAWRAINGWLIHGSIASHQRNVLLRNDGHGGFDEVSGAAGLDLDQDGRSFAVLDIDRDGDPDLAIMAARQAPQVRVFRNDVEPRGASVAIRLVGTTSNRDAIGARVSVETGELRRTRTVHAGSGFLSQHSKEVLFGIGPSRRVLKLTVAWPSGQTQVFTDLPVNRRFRLTEGGTLTDEPFAPKATVVMNAEPTRTVTSTAARVEQQTAAPPESTWMYEPFPAPDFSLQGSDGAMHTLAELRGRPALLLLWSAKASASRAALDALARGKDALANAGIGSLAISFDSPQDASPAVAPRRNVPNAVATSEVALSYAILNRHLFMNRQDLRLPTALLLDAAGMVERVYRHPLDVTEVVRDAAATAAGKDERLARALPFPGTFYSPPGLRNYLPYGRELLDQGLEAAAVVAFERAAQANPSASTLYRLGTLLSKSGEPARARAALERALALKPDFAEASNDLGTLLAQDGQLEPAIALFRRALASAPDYPDALNNLAYALLLSGHEQEARGLYEKAIALQPDFPEALNNLGLLLGRGGDMPAAERHFRQALAQRDDYAEAANNLALVLVSRGAPDQAIALLETFLQKTPQAESVYITLAKVYFSLDRAAEGTATLERLLQRNPAHPVALELLRQLKRR